MLARIFYYNSLFCDIQWIYVICSQYSILTKELIYICIYINIFHISQFFIVFYIRKVIDIFFLTLVPHFLFHNVVFLCTHKSGCIYLWQKFIKLYGSWFYMPYQLQSNRWGTGNLCKITIHIDDRITKLHQTRLKIHVTHLSIAYPIPEIA